MKLIIIVGIGSNYAIGKAGRLPWEKKQRADMKHFVEITERSPMIMGRKTYESFPNGPLPHRTNIVITRQDPYLDPRCIRTSSLMEAVEVAKKETDEKAFIIGGGQIYREALPITDSIELTVFHHEFEADTFFPRIDALEWREIARTDHPADEKNEYYYSFVRFERIRPRE